MKFFLTISLTFFALQGFAQTQFHDWDKMDVANAQRLVQPYLSSKMDTALVRRFTLKLDSVFTVAFGKKLSPGFSTNAIICISTSGNVDHIVFSFDSDIHKLDRLKKDEVLRKRNAALLEVCRLMNFSPQKKNWSMSVYHYFGMLRREKHTGDSLLTQIQDLETYHDSLKIKKIYLDNLELTKVPDAIYRFPNLEELFINSNWITALRIDFQKLPKLTQLHANHNRISNDSLFFTQNKSLKILNLNQNKFHDIPVALNNCRKLESLWLAANDLKSLSGSGLKYAKKVRDLNLYQTKISLVPKELKKLKRLEVLDLYHNELTEVPSGVIRLKRLTQLAISHNKIKFLPEKLYRLKRLHTLYAHHNWLASLPKRFDSMQNIQTLDLGYNWFVNFPESILKLKNLKELDFSSNYLADFPTAILQIGNIEKLFLRGNPFLRDVDAEKRFGPQLRLLKDRNIEVFY